MDDDMSSPDSVRKEEGDGDVVALAADLASRQAAAAAQRPRHHHAQSVGIQGEGHGRRPSDELERGSGSASNSVALSPKLRKKRSLTSHQHGKQSNDAPKIDEEAIYQMTAQQRDDGHDGDQGEGSAAAALETNVAPSASMQSLPRSSPTSHRSAFGQEDLDAAERKRMTVVIDEEMPSDDADGEEPMSDANSAENVDGNIHDAEEVGQAHEQQATSEEESLIMEERDADIGEAPEDAEDVSKARGVHEVNGEEGNVDLAQSMATLRAAHEEGRPDEDIAHKEQEEDVEDDEDEDEPSLKYARLRGSVPDMLKRDSASALAVSDRFLALGTHGGSVYIIDEQGNLIKGFRTHSASVLALAIDSTAEFVGSAGMDGLVSVAGLSSSESYTFDFKRVMRSVSLEPGFGRRSTRSFVCGGMAGQLVLREKSWFGHREVILHEGEGPIWTTQWQGNLIAWANDKGIRIYDTANKQRITFISPPDDNPRADLFRCTLFWQDDTTLLIAWADTIKVAKIRARDHGDKSGSSALTTSNTHFKVEITAILQLDCMISGLAPRGKDYLILAYITDDEVGDDSSFESHKRREGQRPELRLVSKDGEELSSDVLSLQSFARFQCNDYLLVPSTDAILNGAAAVAPTNDSKLATAVPGEQGDYFYVVSPKDIVIARSRDQRDHVDWLLQHRRYEEALAAVQAMGHKEAVSMGFDANVIGAKYLTYLIHVTENWQKASEVAPSILKDNAQAWEDVVFAFVEKEALPHLIHQIPVSNPTLSPVVYDMILAHLLRYNVSALLDTTRIWPVDIYSTRAVILALEDKLGQSDQDDKVIKDARQPSTTDRLVMECLAEIHLRNRQPGRALPYYMRLRKPGVFDLIREHNLFTVVQDQALLLVEFEADLISKSGHENVGQWQSIVLLVDHTHSIPIHRVVPQLQGHRRFLYLYLNALFERDPQLVAIYSDTLVELYAEFEYDKLMSYLRAMSSYYSFEKAYNICKSLDYVPEMVFLLSRIGDNKTALMLIIERLGDVERSINFVKEEKDPELWENLVHYSEDKPKFIRGLLENVGGEVDAVTLIRRIKDGLEIEGLRDALIKILGDFNLQVCQQSTLDVVPRKAHQHLYHIVRSHCWKVVQVFWPTMGAATVKCCIEARIRAFTAMPTCSAARVESVCSAALRRVLQR